MTLAETIEAGLNNPECSFFVGQSLGQASLTGNIVTIMLLIGLFKIIDKLAWEPLIAKLKSKLYKKKAPTEEKQT